MLLSKILEVICPQDIRSYKKNINIRYITANSKLIKKNSIYITDFTKNIKKAFIHQAIINGTIAILTNKRINNLKIPQFIVENLSSSVDLILNFIKKT